MLLPADPDRLVDKLKRPRIISPEVPERTSAQNHPSLRNPGAGLPGDWQSLIDYS